MMFIVVCSKLAVCIFILFIRASGNWEYCHWNATKRIIAGASGLVLLPPNNKGRWMKHLVVELLGWRTLTRVAFVALLSCKSDSLPCQLLDRKNKSWILPPPLLVYFNSGVCILSVCRIICYWWQVWGDHTWTYVAIHTPSKLSRAVLGLVLSQNLLLFVPTSPEAVQWPLLCADEALLVLVYPV